MNLSHSLAHQFLIAMPSLDATWFEKTVIYIIDDNEKGSTGLVINKPHNLNVLQLLEHFHIYGNQHSPMMKRTVMMGGPVDMERGFILHQPTGKWQNTVNITPTLGLTVSEDFLEAIKLNNAPQDFLICLGTATWTKGQLTHEIKSNSWLTAPFNASLMFETPVEKRWKAALGILGVSPEFLSAEAGHA
ncbi:YqgE/AlgH family protein [Thiomicrospira microaerophila]|uniref:YqgE/AlgH family protein n=1 Tax=Thiomicrospira microaerophila TaxID=406020 RepID=UPI0005CB13AA|nr:YqgE/AlgH family protein [Thiomicrospira microaerophila]